MTVVAYVDFEMDIYLEISGHTMQRNLHSQNTSINWSMNVDNPVDLVEK